MLDFVIFFLIAMGSFIFGTFAFAQIIGGIRAKGYIFAVIFWSLLVIGITVYMILCQKEHIWEYAIPMAISFFVMISQRNIS